MTSQRAVGVAHSWSRERRDDDADDGVDSTSSTSSSDAPIAESVDCCCLFRRCGTPDFRSARSCNEQTAGSELALRRASDGTSNRDRLIHYSSKTAANCIILTSVDL